MKTRLVRGSIAALMLIAGWQASFVPAPAVAAHSSPAAPPRVVRWQHGDDEVLRLMPADRGFCYVSGVSGHFAGAGEAVRVYVDDGCWYLGGRSCQPGLWVEATCIEWPVTAAAAGSAGAGDAGPLRR